MKTSTISIVLTSILAIAAIGAIQIQCVEKSQSGETFNYTKLRVVSTENPPHDITDEHWRWEPALQGQTESDSSDLSLTGVTKVFVSYKDNGVAQGEHQLNYDNVVVRAD